jgi:hypothetical protein
MHIFDETEDFVNENDNGYASNVLLKETGDIWTLKEFHENVYHYGYTRKKKKNRPLGRAAEADAEQQMINQARLNFRRKRGVIDLANCNEQELRIWFSYTYARNEQDLRQFHTDRKAFYQRLVRFVQTGNLYGKPVKSFTPCPDFQLKAVGVIDFQDGDRRDDGVGRGAIHGHQIMNTPFLSQVRVIVANVYDFQDGEYKEAYLQIDGSWSLSANRQTRWFDWQYEADEFIKAHDTLEDMDQVHPRSKPLCVVALLWEQGNIDIKTIQNMRETGKLSDVGQYMVSRYMIDNLYDERLQGRKAYFFTGDLTKPTIYRDVIDVNNHLEALHMWENLVDQKELIGHYIGAFTVYVFNFWVSVYPWIKAYYERKRHQHQQEITQIDWVAIHSTS